MSLVHRGCLLWFSCCQWSPHSLRRQPEDLSTTATTFPAADFMSQLGPLMSHQGPAAAGSRQSTSPSPPPQVQLLSAKDHIACGLKRSGIDRDTPDSDSSDFSLFATGSNTSNPSQLQSPPLRLSAAYDHQPGLRDPPRIFGPNPFILQPGQPSLLTWPPQAMYPGAATPGQELLSLTSTAASTGSLGRTLGGQQQMLVPAVAQLPEASQVSLAAKRSQKRKSWEDALRARSGPLR
eukprot:jgi/Astpho2/1622/Aster-07941